MISHQPIIDRFHRRSYGEMFITVRIAFSTIWHTVHRLVHVSLVFYSISRERCHDENNPMLQKIGKASYRPTNKSKSHES